MRHTPTPFKALKTKYKDGPVYWIKSGDIFVGKVYSHDGQPAGENAAFIVRAVNAHEKLVELLKWVTEEFERGERKGYQAKISYDMDEAIRQALAALEEK